MLGQRVDKVFRGWKSRSSIKHCIDIEYQASCKIFNRTSSATSQLDSRVQEGGIMEGNFSHGHRTLRHIKLPSFTQLYAKYLRFSL